MTLAKLVKLGTITRVHGVRGAFVIQTPSDKESALSSLKSILIGKSETENSSYTLKEAAWMPTGWKIESFEVTTIEAATKLIGQSVYTTRESLPAPKEKEYYEMDLKGLEAYSFETKELFGTFVASEPVGATKDFQQDRWWFMTKSGETSIPATKRYIEKVDIENKKIWLKNLSDFEDTDDT